MRAATKLFAEKGFSGTRTREIASAAGISETLIFQHFKSKEELYKAILLENLAHHPLQPEIAPYTALEDDYAVFYTTAAHLLKNMNEPLVIRLFLFAALENPELLHFFPRSDQHGIKRLLGDYIQQRITEGTFKNIDPYIAAQSFIYSVSMFCIEQILSGNRQIDSDHAFINSVVNLFLKGLKA